MKASSKVEPAEGSTRGSSPARTCVGCRQRCAPAELVRLVLVGGTVTVVSRARPAGRGAWLHAQRSCVNAAIKSRAFGRAFRAAVEPPDVDAFYTALVTSFTRQPQRGG